MNKIAEQLVIDKERYILERLLEKKYITEKDIIQLMNQDNSYGIFISSSDFSDKDLYMKKLFRKPYLLCDQNVSDNIKKLLPIFIDRLYNLELNSLNNHLLENDLTYGEYREALLKLKYKMYESSEDGKSIKENGNCVGINDKVLKLIVWFLIDKCYNIKESNDERVVISLII